MNNNINKATRNKNYEAFTTSTNNIHGFILSITNNRLANS